MAKHQLTILQLVPDLDVGGAERATVDVAAALVQAGYRALVMSAGGAMVSELTQAGAKHFEHDIGRRNPWHAWKNVDRLARFIRDESVDLVHARSRIPAWSAYFAAGKSNVPLVTTFHNAYSGNSAGKKLYNSVMVRSDRVIAISRFIAEHIRSKYQIPPERIALIPRGINFSVYDPAVVGPERREQFRLQNNLRSNTPLLIMPARLSPTKCHELVLRALASLGSQPFHCLIIGPDQGRKDYRAQLYRLVRQLGLQDKVNFVERSDLPTAYAMADLVFSLSRKEEGFGRVAVEAQAMGVPVIASRIGAFSETVADGETGWLVPNDERALAQAIGRSLALGAEQRKTMAQKAIQRVRVNYDVKQMCSSTLEVYADLLRKRGIPRLANSLQATKRG